MFSELIIDGYNLLHVAGLARARHGPGDLERARTRLLQRLARDLTEEERGAAVVIFDAQYARHVDRGESVAHGIRVRFSEQNQEADEAIERLIDAHPETGRLTVVSSDNRVITAARRAGALPVDSDRFLTELSERRPRRVPDEPEEFLTPDIDPNPPVQAVELDRWLEEFGEIDVDSLLRPTGQDRLRATRSVADKSGDAPQGFPTPSASGKNRPNPPPGSENPAESGPGESDDPAIVDQEELRFWEERISQALREASPRKPPGE